MAVFRVNKTKDYVTMGKYHFKEKDMSLKAIGMLSLMLSLPDEWDYSVNGLTTMRSESKNTINSILNELEEFGYLKRTRNYVNGKISNWTYDIYEKPLHRKNQDIEKLDIENVDIEKLDIENCTQLNNNQLSNKQTNNNQVSNNKYYDDVELNDLFIEYLNLRKKIKAINTERAIKGLLNKLEPYPDDIKKEMIEESIVNSWKSVYPLKEEKLTAKERHDSQLEVLEGLYNGTIKID